jgi:hypothetical protein
VCGAERPSNARANGPALKQHLNGTGFNWCDFRWDMSLQEFIPTYISWQA